MYSHSAGSLRIRFRGSFDFAAGVDGDDVAAGDATVAVDDANTCDCSDDDDDDDDEETVVAEVVSASANRVDNEHCVVRLHDGQVVVDVVGVDENVIGANADPWGDSNTSSNADNENLVILLIMEDDNDLVEYECLKPELL